MWRMEAGDGEVTQISIILLLKGLTKLIYIYIFF